MCEQRQTIFLAKPNFLKHDIKHKRTLQNPSLQVFVVRTSYCIAATAFRENKHLNLLCQTCHFNTILFAANYHRYGLSYDDHTLDSFTHKKCMLNTVTKNRTTA